MGRYRCNHCGWTGDKPASCIATIAGAIDLEKETVAMSVCPRCCFVASSINREKPPATLFDRLCTPHVPGAPRGT